MQSGGDGCLRFLRQHLGDDPLYAANAPGRYLLLTECSMGDNIAAANPDKEMLRLCSVRCPHMNQITMENTLKCTAI